MIDCVFGGARSDGSVEAFAMYLVFFLVHGSIIRQAQPALQCLFCSRHHILHRCTSIRHQPAAGYPHRRKDTVVLESPEPGLVGTWTGKGIFSSLWRRSVFVGAYKPDAVFSSL